MPKKLSNEAINLKLGEVALNSGTKKGTLCMFGPKSGRGPCVQGRRQGEGLRGL